MHKIIAALAAFFFASSALAADLKDENYTGRDAGYIVMAVRHARDLELPMFSLNFRTQDLSDTGYVTYVSPPTILGAVPRTPDISVDNEIGTVIVRALPPGDYAFYRFGTKPGIGIRLSLPFTVKAGETTYLGEFRILHWLQKRDVFTSLLRSFPDNRRLPLRPFNDAEQPFDANRIQPTAVVAEGHLGGRGLPVNDTGAVPPGESLSPGDLGSGYYFIVTDNLDRDIAIALAAKGLPKGTVTASVLDSATLNIPFFRAEVASQVTAGATIAAFSDGRFAMTRSNTAQVNTRAIKGFTTAISAGDLWPYYQVEALNSRGIAHLRMGQLDEAIADFSEAIVIDRFAFAAYSNRGLARRLKGELAAAIADQTEALNIAPNYAMAYMRRATTYLADNKPELALADIDDAVRLDPENAFVYADRGAVHRELGEFELAVADYSKAIEIKRLDEIIPEHYNARGYLYLEIYGRTGTLENYVGRCMALLALGNAERTLRDCDRAVSMNSKSADIFLFRGLANLKLGRSPRALEDFSTAARLDPTNPGAVYGRGLVKSKMGDATAGTADMDQAKAMNAGIAATMAKYGATP